MKSEQSDSVALEARSLLPTEAVDNRGDSKVEMAKKNNIIIILERVLYLHIIDNNFAHSNY